VKELKLYGTSGKKFAVQKVIIHDGFELREIDENSGNKLKRDYNVGLLTTEADIPFSLHLNAICLPESDKFGFKGKKGIVVGWGYDKSHQLSQTLQQLEVPTFPFLDCFYRNREFFTGHSSKRNFCAGYSKDKGICTGDAGGGLYMKIGKKFVLFGLSSESNCKCVMETNTCEVSDEGIFINLPAYVQWIHNNMY
jgi:secreted trypsin-like serine protease